MSAEPTVMPMIDREARKQLLLTRIAMERAEWIREVGALRNELSPSELLASAVRAAVGVRWAQALFGGQRPASAGGAGSRSLVGRVFQLVWTVRRHPILWSLAGGILPWLQRRRQSPRRRVWFGGLGVLGVAAAATAGWWVWSRRASSPDRR